MSQTDVTLAGCTIGLHAPHPIKVTDNFRPFLGENGSCRFDVTVREVDKLPALHTPPLFTNYAFSVCREGETYFRRYHDRKENDRPYAIGRIAGNRETVDYLTGDQQFFSETANCFSHIALEEILLHFDRLILHASLVETQWGGLLFSGPPGIGKSTQAALWEREEGAVQLNGDRPILSRDSNGWTAWGSPYAGSSRCFVNRGAPIRAVVMLEQGTTCRLTRLPVAAAFQRLYAQTTVNAWNPAYVQRVCTLLTQLAEEIPIYHLICTPDRRAVEILRDRLQQGGG